MKRSARMVMGCAVLVVAGCSSVGGARGEQGGLLQSNRDAIKIESDPAGAAVYVLGKQVGITPLVLSPNEIFPLTYPREMQSLYGKLTLKKAGCADLVQPVTQNIMNVGLHAQLDCGDLNPAPSAIPGGTPPRTQSAEQRLERIKDLLDKGLITEEEAKKARARVLNEL